MSCFKHFTLIAGAVLLLAGAPAALGQKWEVGAGGGASLYNSKTITAGSAAVDAKFKPGYGFSAYLGQIGDRLGGEVRYTWLSNDMELSGAGKNFTMGGHTQAIHYDVSFYFNPRKSKTRPYLFAGGGMKQYTGKGPAQAVQPLGSIVVLTDTSEWKPLISGGGGVRFAVGEKA
ncbi:MAG: outer membrane beta-barrel protein, partial [Acidobacteria bacterium]|nr:outer membrane beta-barrel protein [Acidobacteriota bacterium]